MRVALLLALIVWAPMALAQAPEGASVAVSAGAVEAASLDAPGSAVFTVAFESPNPIDAQQARSIRLSVSGAESGWTYSLSASTLELTAGTEAQVTVTVAVSGEAEADASSVTLRAQLVPFGLDAIPTLGPLLDPAAEDSATAQVAREDSATRAVVETLGPWIYVILAGLVIAIVVAAKLLSDSRRRFVDLDAKHQDVEIKPGQSIAVPVTVRNLGRGEDTMVFHVMTVAPGWAASLPVPELDLDGGAVEEMQLIVHAPEDAEPGDRHAIGITAHCGAAPRRVAEVVIQVTVA